ncbi:MAG TPA: hypothetical protein GXZ23_06680 [Clostridiales bacterium]|nr:hypothetical protein [Clostridiales bacterium]
MIFLYILLGIIAFFVTLFSIKASIAVSYKEDLWHADVRWLFLKLSILPYEKKEKKKKKPKKEPKKEEPPQEEKPAEEKPKKKGKNPFKTFYKNKGVDGVVELLSNTVSALGGMFGKILRGFTINELFLDYTVSGNDAAVCAINYGERCSQIWPLLGYICSCMKVRKYDANIEPDFLADKDTIEFSTKISVRPITLTNAVVILLGKLIKNVVIKFLAGMKTKTKTKTKSN